MNRNLTKRIMGLLLALVLLISNLPATAFATEETEATQPAAEAMSRAVHTELGATIEQQVRAFAKSINKTDADDDAAVAIANHGITGGGKKLAVGKNHALTATLMNSELGLATVIQGCALGIQQMQQLNLSEAFVLSGTYWGSNPLNFFNIIFPEILEKNTPSNTLQICHADEKNYTGKTNGYDSSLGWIAGSANARTTITKASVTADTVTYNVTVSFEDRFDFSASSNSGFKNLISGFGALLFKEFDWTATASFSLTVENGCPHDTDAYYWHYDAETQNMASVTTDEFGENQTEKYTVAKNGGSVFYYELDQMVTLLHNVPWELEYTVKKPGYFVLSPTPDSQNACYEMALYYRTHFFIQNTERIEGIYKTHCYGYTFANLFNYAKDQLFTVRLENVIQADGSNMIYVSVYNHDLQQTVLEPLPMDDYYWMQSGVLTLRDDESRGLSGEDLRIKYIGNAKYPFDSEIFELKVWENGKNGESDSCFTDKLTKPTCAAKGYTTHTCALCGYSYKDTYVAALGHSYGDWVQKTSPSCTAQGEEQRTCKTCKGTETRDIAPIGHSYDVVVAPPTCTGEGYTTHTCTTCSENFADNHVSATGHSYTLNGNHTCDICKYSKTPGQPVVENKTNHSVTLVQSDGFEYSKDGIVWQSSNVFVGLSADTTYTFYQRVKASATTLVSEVSAVLTVKTDEESVYTIVFKDWDGTVLSAKTYHYGDKVSIPANPTKEANEIYRYEFTGWDKAVTTVTGDAEYTANYTSVYISYTVVFRNYDGSILSEQFCHYGDPINIPENPTRYTDETYTYVFAGWDREVTKCYGDEVYTATYTSSYRDYGITFIIVAVIAAMGGITAFVVIKKKK